MARRRSNLRNRLELGLFTLAQAAAARLGPRSLARLGGAVGDLFDMIPSRRREIMQFNLRLAFPELEAQQRQALERRVARHFGRVAFDTLRLRRLKPEELMKEVVIVGSDNLQQASEHSNGLFVLSAHLGSWEVSGLVAGGFFPGGIAAVNRPLDNPYLDEKLARYRRLFGNVALGKHGAARAMLTRIIKDKQAVGILIDQRVDESSGIQVPFFGQPAWTHTILARLVKRTGAPVLPLWGIWEAPGRYTVRFDPPIMPNTLTSEELEEEPLTARFSAVTEAIIREYPDQWLWYHDRWRELRLGEG